MPAALALEHGVERPEQVGRGVDQRSVEVEDEGRRSGMVIGSAEWPNSVAIYASQIVILP